jgi:hypothetical protein
MTGTDRILRLYQIDYDNMKNKKKSLFLLNEF